MRRALPIGFAGTYDVDLSGRGEGDALTQSRWTPPADGPLPVPEARLAMLADHDGAVDTYGVELQATNLAASPDEAMASITVAAADGRSLTFDATQEPSEDLGPEGCSAIQGQRYWMGPDDKGLEAAELGRPPFTYTVVLVLDGVTHVATAAWPDDEIPDSAPSVSVRRVAVACVGYVRDPAA